MYLSEDSRVIGVEVDGEWLALPHNVMYRHEIVNLNVADERVAVTYCPLTGSPWPSTGGWWMMRSSAFRDCSTRPT